MPHSSSHQPRPIEILRIITRLNIGGPSIQAAHLTTALERHGYHTRLIHGRLGRGEGDMSYLLPPSADAVELPTLRRRLSPVADVRTLVRLYREIRTLRPDIVHTHMAKAGMLGRIAAAACNLTRGSSPRARIVHTYHGHVLEGYFGPILSAVFIALERLLGRSSDAVVTVSPAIRRELLETYRIGGEIQHHVIPLGFDLAPFAAIDETARRTARQALNLPEAVPVITTVGRLTAIKQHQLFLDTIARLKRRYLNAVALIAGDGELRHDLEAQAARLGMTNHVRWLGWRRDLATIYGATDIFLLTSRNEGTPVAIIEAMASAVAPVSTDVGGVKDVIDSPQVGVLAPFGDVAALTTGIERLLSDPAGRRAMGERARARVLQKFGADRLVADIVRLYEDLLRQH